jgi:hypothetical protein
MTHLFNKAQRDSIAVLYNLLGPVDNRNLGIEKVGFEDFKTK